MGRAILVPGADYRSLNLGCVTPSGSNPITSISITGPSSVFVSATFIAKLTPTFTTERGVIWSITSGSQWASIDSNGTLTGVPEISNKSVTIRCTSSSNSAVYAEKTITLTTDALVYYDYITSDGTDFIIMPGLNNIWNATVTARLKHGGANTYMFMCFYASDSTQARLAAYNNASNKVSAYTGTGGTYNVADVNTNVLYRYVWNLGTSGANDSSFYLYNDATDAVIGSKTSVRITMSGLVWIFRYGVGAAGSTPSADTTVLTPSGAKFYGMTVVDSNNNILAEYKPCLYNGVAGIYDTVSQVFRSGHLGTGGLSVGND